MLLPATALLCYVLVMPFVQGNVPTMVATVTAIILGAIMYPTLQLAKRKGWCEFSEVHFGVGNVWGPPEPVSSAW